jgi:hypothetical protein
MSIFLIKNPSLSVARYRSFEILEKCQTKAFFSYPIDILGSKHLESFDKKGPSIQKDLVEALIHSKDLFLNYNSHD